MFAKKGWGWDKKAAYTFAKGHGGYYSANHVYWQENWLSASRYDVDMHQVFFCLQQGLFLRLEFQVANYTKNTFQFEEAFAIFMKFLRFWLMSHYRVPDIKMVFFQVVMLVLFMKKILFMIMVLNCIPAMDLWICQQPASNCFSRKVK